MVEAGSIRPRVSLVVPVLNEEESIPLFFRAVRGSTWAADCQVEIVFVNDGSRDGTEAVIDGLAAADDDVVGIHFSRNFGKESALMAGLEAATGDVVVPIDVDLQDPVDLIPELIRKWRDGAEVVLAKRVDRSSDALWKRKSAEWFYRLHNRIASPALEENVGDFRLMDRRVVDALKLLPERKLFMKGLFAWVGFKTELVTYARPERVAGRSKFNGWKLWNLAIEGITSFSTLPLRLWSYLGLVVALFALVYAAFLVADKLLFGNDVPGYPSLMTAILFLGGVQLIGIGVLGEYVGRIYEESKQRPRYVVRRRSGGPTS